MSDETYQRARGRIERFTERDMAAAVSDEGRTLLFDHGRRTPRATLLLHGLSASPRQFLAVATQLHERGHNVFVPRLPRHGHPNRLSEALATMNAAQLQACASDALAVTRGLGGHVAVAGFSLGGLLAAYLGQFEDVDRIVALSPFLGVSMVPNLFQLRIARYVLSRPNRFLWWDPILRERQLPEHGYPRFATHAVGHGITLAHELMNAARQAPPRAKELVLIVNTRDSTVNKRAIGRLARYWTAGKPGAVRIVRLTDLPLFLHDVIEPKRYPEVSKRVTPLVVECIDA